MTFEPTCPPDSVPADLTAYANPLLGISAHQIIRSSDHRNIGTSEHRAAAEMSGSRDERQLRRRLGILESTAEMNVSGDQQEMRVEQQRRRNLAKMSDYQDER